MQCVFFFNISKHYFWTKASRASAYSLDIFKFFVLFWSSIFLYYIFLWKKCSRGRPGIGMSVIILIHQPEKYSKSSRYREHGIQLRKPWDLLNKIWLSFFSYTWLIWRISSSNEHYLSNVYRYDGNRYLIILSPSAVGREPDIGCQPNSTRPPRTSSLGEKSWYGNQSRCAWGVIRRCYI